MMLPIVDVVGLGLNAMDTICVLDRFPEPDTKSPIRAIRLEPGGQVATALVSCARLGLSTRYIGSVGADDLGRRQLQSLTGAGLTTEFVRIVENARTQSAIILLEHGVGERTILWDHDPLLSYPPSALLRESIVSGRVLHLDGCDTAAALQAARWAREASIPVVIDIDELYDASTEELLQNVDYLIAAEEFVGRTVGRVPPEDGVRRLAGRYGCRVVGVTLGSRGAVFVAGEQVLHSPGFQVPTADTTGAGDVFHAGFIYGLLQNWPLDRMVRFANAIAALKCTQVGARAGVPTLAQVEQFLQHRP